MNTTAPSNDLIDEPVAKAMMTRFWIVIILALASAIFADAETVEVKYRGPVDLKPFVCQEITRSSFINRVCYDAKERYMVILLKATYYHYCELLQATLSDLLRRILWVSFTTQI